MGPKPIQRLDFWEKDLLFSVKKLSSFSSNFSVKMHVITQIRHMTFKKVNTKRFFENSNLHSHEFFLYKKNVN